MFDVQQLVTIGAAVLGALGLGGVAGAKSTGGSKSRIIVLAREYDALAESHKRDVARLDSTHALVLGLKDEQIADLKVREARLLDEVENMNGALEELNRAHIEQAREVLRAVEYIKDLAGIAQRDRRADRG